MNAQIPIPGPASVGELLDRSFRLYRAHFRSLVKTAAVFMVPYAVISAYMTGNSMLSMLSLFQTIMDQPAELPDQALLVPMASMFQNVGLTWVIMIVGMAVIALSGLALMHQTVGILKGEAGTLGNHVRGAGRRFWTLVGMNILQYLAIIGIVFAAAIVLFLLALLFGLAASGFSQFLNEGGALATGGMFVVLFCLYPLLILAVLAPMFYLIIRWMVAGVGIVERQWGSRESLRESWRLTKGNVWRCLGFALLLYIVSAVVVQAPVMVLQMVMLFVGTDMLAVGVTITTLASTLLNIVWQPLSVIAIVFLYFDLLMRQEGWDIDQRLARLEAEVAQPVTIPASIESLEFSGDAE